MIYNKEELLYYLKNTYKDYDSIDLNIKTIEVHHKSNTTDLVILVYETYFYNLYIISNLYLNFIRKMKINKL